VIRLALQYPDGAGATRADLAVLWRLLTPLDKNVEDGLVDGDVKHLASAAQLDFERLVVWSPTCRQAVEPAATHGRPARPGEADSRPRP
jgi:hypothetical protein